MPNPEFIGPGMSHSRQLYGLECLLYDSPRKLGPASGGEPLPEAVYLVLEVVEGVVIAEDVVAAVDLVAVGDHLGEAAVGFGFERGGVTLGCAGDEASYLELVGGADEDEVVEALAPVAAVLCFTVLRFKDQGGLYDDDSFGVLGEDVVG